jgi:hypothetical protein
VRITNPLDAPLETLGLPPERADGLEVSYDADEGVLTLTVTPELLTGCAHCVRSLRMPAPRRSLQARAVGRALTRARVAIRSAAGTDPRGVLTSALIGVTYTHASKAPDTSPRAVTFVVANAAGSVSQPAVTVVYITCALYAAACARHARSVPAISDAPLVHARTNHARAAVNNPPVLRLTGPAGAVNGTFKAVLLESERMTPVAIADPSLQLTDVDSDAMQSLSVAILGRANGAAEVRARAAPESCARAHMCICVMTGCSSCARRR